MLSQLEFFSGPENKGLHPSTECIARIFKVGISYNDRTYAEGKKICWEDGFRALYCIVRYGLFD
jgi:hypothetical protein